jgi:hypothetical protein
MDHILKVTPFVAPDHLYVALSTTDPGEAGAGITEPVAMGYVRVICDDWTVASDSTGTNTSDITFPASTGLWGTIAYFAVFDALTGGNQLFYGPVDISRLVQSGDTAVFYAGNFVVLLD